VSICDIEGLIASRGQWCCTHVELLGADVDLSRVPDIDSRGKPAQVMQCLECPQEADVRPFGYPR